MPIRLGYPRRQTKAYTRIPSATSKPFRFNAGRDVAEPPTELGGGPPTPVPSVSETMVIQGKVVKSEPEWNFYYAMRVLGFPEEWISYQEAFMGGRRLGGQVLDFVLRFGGAPVAVRIMGAYWHPFEYGTVADAVGAAQLSMAGYLVVDIEASDLDTPDAAMRTIRRLGLA